MGLLDGTVALVTGAGRGIGRGVVRRYVREGARVAALDLSAESVHAVARELGPAVLPIVANVSRPADHRAAVNATLAAFGRLDTYVANAGIYDHGVPLSGLTLEQIASACDEILAINVRGVLLGIRAALPALHAARGSVIVTASYASFLPAGGGALYTASKHAVVGIVRQLAYEFAPDVRVNGVAPGVAPTQLRGIEALGQAPKEAVLPGTELALPTQAIPDADDFGGVYAMLAAPSESRHITGTIVNVDSGLAIRGLARPAGGLAKPTA
jgi:NAD(P)-dependent dehydrogenase (short-subunit alcohol dehydrogenase family)